MKKQVKLYNVLFPVWLLWLFPQILVIVLPGNLLIDCLVLYCTLRVLKHAQKKAVVKELMWKFWFRGFGADLLGAAWLFCAMIPMDMLGRATDLYRPWSNPLAFLCTLSGVAVAGVCIYFSDKKAMEESDLLTDREKHIIALTMAIVTAPWLFFWPIY